MKASGNGAIVVDADGHIIETKETWASLHRKFEAWKPTWVMDSAGVPRVMLEGRLYQKPLGEQAPGAPEGWLAPNKKATNNGGSDPKGRLLDMDIEGIDIAVLYPTLGLAIGGLKDPAFATEFCRAYNDWLTEYCEVDETRLKGVAIVALQDVDSAVRELQRAVRDLGMVGVMISSNVQGKNLSRPEFGRFFAAAQEIGVPVGIHTSTGFYLEASGEDRFDNFPLAHAASFPFEGMLAVASFVCEGILEKFPRLKVLFLEAGIGWVPYWIERLHEHYELRRSELPHMKMPPHEYVKNRACYFSFEVEEKGLPSAIDVVGNDRVLYASDYPHWDATCPESVKIVKNRTDLTEEVKAKLLGRNAIDVYQLQSPRISRTSIKKELVARQS